MFDEDQVLGGGEGDRELRSARGMLVILGELRRQASKLSLGERTSRGELGDCLALAELSLLRLIADEGDPIDDLIAQH